MKFSKVETNTIFEEMTGIKIPKQTTSWKPNRK